MQTDHQFHALGYATNRYRFRTPTLRNVAVTGPWEHDGAYGSLLAIVKYHLQPQDSQDNYDTTQARMPSRENLGAIDFEVYTRTR